MFSELKQARINAGYTIEEIADNLNIKKQYLIALEDGNIDALPAKVYIDGYLKLYARHLGITLPASFKESKEQKHTPSTRVINQKFQKYVIVVSIFMLAMIIKLVAK